MTVDVDDGGLVPTHAGWRSAAGEHREFATGSFRA